MEVPCVLCMKGGDGENSYAKNSSIQAAVIEGSRTVVVEAIIKLVEQTNDTKLKIADLGCGSGPNTLSTVANMADTIEQACQRLSRPHMEFQFFLNDLPRNDFNYIFSSIQANNVQGTTKLSLCFITGVAGSFYERLFPQKSVDFFHSSFSLQWLSQDPLKYGKKEGLLINKGKKHITKETPSFIKDAFEIRFKQDFSNFLRLQSVEMSGGGRMVLTLIGRRGYQASTDDFASQKFDLVSTTLMEMVEEGLIPEEKVDSFNIPHYAPCPDEVAHEVLKEGSFSLDCLKVYDADRPTEEGGTSLNMSKSQRLAKTMQAVLEPLLESHFGRQIIGDLFTRAEKLLDKPIPGNTPSMVSLLVSLVRKF